MSCIFYFNPVIIDSYTHRTTCIMELSVTKGIRQGFTQSFSGNFKFFFSCKAYYFAAKRKMFEEECHTSIKQREEVSVCTLVVNELSFVISTESSHTEQKLGKLTGISKE